MNIVKTNHGWEALDSKGRFIGIFKDNRGEWEFRPDDFEMSLAELRHLAAFGAALSDKLNKITEWAVVKISDRGDSDLDSTRGISDTLLTRGQTGNTETAIQNASRPKKSRPSSD